MGQDSKIQWTHHTFNPWRGCTKVSPGCANCYAEAMSKRNPAALGVWGDGGTRVVASEGQWREPLKWDKAAKAEGVRKRVFCASLAEVFEDWGGYPTDSKGNHLGRAYDGTFYPAIGESVEPITLVEVRARLFDTIRSTPNLDWLLLTKRPENWAKILREVVDYERDAGRYKGGLNHPQDWTWVTGKFVNGWLHGDTPQFGHVVPPNIWVGTTVENQEQAEKRIPILLKIPAAVRFLSVEPMLGPINLSGYLGFQHEDEIGIENPDQSLPREQGVPFHDPWVRGPDWVICGGESGPQARNFNIKWACDLRDQCKSTGVPFFMKQLGARPFTNNFGGVFRTGGFLGLRDSHGADPDEWPEDLRVREFPAPVPA